MVDFYYTRWQDRRHGRLPAGEPHTGFGFSTVQRRFRAGRLAALTFMMAKPSKTPARNGHVRRERPVSKLGKQLRKLAEEYAASGGELLNRRELERQIAERRR